MGAQSSGRMRRSGRCSARQMSEPPHVAGPDPGVAMTASLVWVVGEDVVKDNEPGRGGPSLEVHEIAKRVFKQV